MAPKGTAHRVHVDYDEDFSNGRIVFAPLKSLWFCAMLVGALLAIFVFPSKEGVGIYALSTAFVLLFGHSLGSHRKFIHDSFQCPRWLEYSLVCCGTLVGLSGPLGLLKQHELRDYAQRLSNCHPYLRHGAGFWRDAWWQLHCDLRFVNDPTVQIEASRNLPFYRFLESTWMVQQLPFAVLLFWLGGWGFVCWGVCARIATCVFGHWLIGYFAHNHGELRYEVHGAAVQGRNIAWTSLLTMGESWHNNHHAYPGSAKLGLQRGEWDPGWWVLSAFNHVGLVWNIVLPEHLPPRSELVMRVANQSNISLEPQSTAMKEAP